MRMRDPAALINPQSKIRTPQSVAFLLEKATALEENGGAFLL